MRRLIAVIVVAFASVKSAGVHAAAGDDLDQRLRIVERKLELGEEAADAKAREAGSVSAGDKGFAIKSADGAFELRVRGLLQADGRFFVGDPAAQALNDTFLFRRIEPVLEVALGKHVYFKLQPQFAGDAASTADAYGELRFAPAFAVRAGRFKEPLGLENLQPSSALGFGERGFPTELAANRDLGVQLQGELLDGTATYAAGLFNGAADGRDAAASDTDSRKEGAARLFFEPFSADPGLLQGLGFGIAGSRGEKRSTIGATTLAAASSANYNNTLPRYRSPGQNTIFAYRLATATTPTAADTVVADGAHTRYSPQAWFSRGSFGLLGEYIASRQEVAIGGNTRTFEHRAWQGLANYLLTGESAGFRGPVKPAHPYAAGAPGWGALELVARYGVLDLDAAAFPIYADPAKSVRRARDTGIGLNWHLTANARVSLDYDETRFTGGAAGGANRDREQALLTRLQLSF